MFRQYITFREMKQTRANSDVARIWSASYKSLNIK